MLNMFTTSDMVYLDKFKNCKYRYLNWVNGRWVKSDTILDNANLVVEKSFNDLWKFVK